MFRTTARRRAATVAATLLGVLVMTTTATAETTGDATVSSTSSAPTAEPSPTAEAETPIGDPVAPAVPADVPTREERMLQFAMKSPATLDMRGVEPSLYRGDFYRASVEKVRQCVAKRESEGHYDVVSHNGYYGAYQMSPALAKGATWMMLREHKRLLGADVASRIMAELRRTPVNEWPRYWQDAAFSTVYNWKHTASGAKHWRGGRWHC